MNGMSIGGAPGVSASAPPFALRAGLWRLRGVADKRVNLNGVFDGRAAASGIFDKAMRFVLVAETEE